MESTGPGIHLPIFKPISCAPSPTSVESYQSFDCRVELNGQPLSNQNVSISTNHGDVFTNLPSSVVVSSGQNSATFTVTAASVSSSVTATITATCNGGSASGDVTVIP